MNRSSDQTQICDCVAKTNAAITKSIIHVYVKVKFNANEKKMFVQSRSELYGIW